MNRRITWLFLMFLVVRLVFALRFPIFNDEASYMRWGMNFWQDPGHWWYFMADGKQPLVAGSFGLVQFLPVDPLIAMRVVSILWSTLTFWSVAAILRRFFPKTDPVIILTLLAWCPFLIFFDTLAIAESPITACAAFLLYVSLSFANQPSIKKGLLLGLGISLGWWTKTTIYLCIPLILMTVALYWRSLRTQWKTVIVGLAGAGAVMLLLMGSIMWNPAFGYSEGQKSIARTVTLAHILTFPIRDWLTTQGSMAAWLFGYIGPLIALSSVVSLWMNRRQREVQVLAVWIVAPIVMESVVLTFFSARLLTMCAVPVLLAAGIWIVHTRNSLIRIGVTASTVLLGLLLTFFPITYYQALKYIPPAQSDFAEYVIGWSSGWGVKEAIHTIIDIAQFRPIVVFVRLHGGNPEEALPPYLSRYHIPVAQVFQMQDIESEPEFAARPWYFVSRGMQFEGLEKYLTQIARFDKPLDSEFVGIYRINKP